MLDVQAAPTDFDRWHARSKSMMNSWCVRVSHFGAVPREPSKRVAMHFSMFRRNCCTAAVSSRSLNQTSRRITLAARGPESLSTRRMPVIMSAGSMVAPTTPRTRLFQYSSTCPPPTLGLSLNWKCPPVAFSLSSHSGRTLSRKIMMASMTWSPSGRSRTIRFCSSSPLGCGMWFHSFQKPCTEEKLATWRVASAYAADSSPGGMVCSQMRHLNRKA
mmetsp:Transcript_72921/g.223201  ORF Transcript_72921/g.223201 Transcript_72921/m.223201 type:complete len:217 (+) Transcript_72921:226-876(+)